MEPTTQRMMMGAARVTGEDGGGNYIAVGHTGTPYFTLLDHTTPGSVSLAATYTLPNSGNGAAFSPN